MKRSHLNKIMVTFVDKKTKSHSFYHYGIIRKQDQIAETLLVIMKSRSDVVLPELYYLQKRN